MGAGARLRDGAAPRRPRPNCSGGTPPGIGAYATDAAAGLVAFTLAGGLWTVDVAGGQARRLPAEGPVTDARPDPAGRRIAYVRGGALRMIEADGDPGSTPPAARHGS